MNAPEPHHGFDDSRRLIGPNRWFAGTAVILTPRGLAAHDSAAHARWAQRVRQVCAALAWPGPQPRAVPHPHEPTLVFAAPEDLLFTATEINEWAWERSAAEAGERDFDLARNPGDEPVAHFAARAAAERRPALSALREATATRRLPMFVDDETVSVGAGAGSRCWPLLAMPAPEGVPWPGLHDVPTALVTGSNGKTTTVRLLAAMAAASGRASGHCCTEGIWVAGRMVQSGDYSGPAGAREVLRHRGVEVAILETARGGILRRGLALRRADVAVVTNISPDHLGEYGVDSAADLAEVKLVVAHAVSGGGMLVLNADDAILMDAAARAPHAASARQALFGRDHDHPALLASRVRGGSTCGVREGELLLWHLGDEHALGAIVDMPLTLHGAARHNIENIAAAALAAAGLGLSISVIRQTLQSFGAQPEDNPGRLERWSHRGATVLIDYAHNPEGLAQLLLVARALQPRRLALLLGQAGNRDGAAIAALAGTAAGFGPDRIVIKELPAMWRGRSAGEVPALLEAALRAAGVPAERIVHEADEEAGAFGLLAWAGPGDLIVLPVHTAAVRLRLVAALGASAQGAAGVASGLPFSTT